MEPKRILVPEDTTKSPHTMLTLFGSACFAGHSSRLRWKRKAFQGRWGIRLTQRGPGRVSTNSWFRFGGCRFNVVGICCGFAESRLHGSTWRTSVRWERPQRFAGRWLGWCVSGPGPCQAVDEEPRLPACLSPFHPLTSIAERTGSPRHASTKKFWAHVFFPRVGAQVGGYLCYNGLHWLHWLCWLRWWC